MGKRKSQSGNLKETHSMPKVSVIIATHNNEENIGECLDSILSPAFSDVEVIAIDVLSTDGTKDILMETSKEDDRVTFLADSMGSIGRAKNIGLGRARAPYVVFVNPEDYLGRGMLEYVYLTFEEDSHINVVTLETDSFGDDSYGRTNNDIKERLNAANEADGRHREMESRLMRHILFGSIFVYRTSYLRENQIKYYDNPGDGQQDFAFKLLSIAKGPMYMVPEIFYYKRMDDSSAKYLI